METRIVNAFNMHGNPLGQVASNGNTFELYYSDILCESQMNFVEWTARKMGMRVLELKSNFAIVQG